MTKLRLGISTCPNDTFAFHGVLEGAVDLEDLELDVRLLDIQELNEGLDAGAFDVAKASFHAALRWTDRYGVLPVGSAIGYGVGPLLLAAHDRGLPDEQSRILCPGADTTATLLLRCLHPRAKQIEHVHFAEIMPALARGDADFGVVIHEGRFTYAEQDLHCAQDLGEEWERRAAAPLPLGGLLARLDLPPELHRRLDRVIRASLDHAHAHREDAVGTMRRHAQELSEEVLWKHVELYVSEATRSLGAEGERALRRMQELAEEAGVIPPGAAALQLLAS